METKAGEMGREEEAATGGQNECMVLLQCKARHGDKSRRVATGGEIEWK